MATTPIIEATTDAVAGEDAEFTTTTRGFWLYGSGFGTCTLLSIDQDSYTYATGTVYTLVS